MENVSLELENVNASETFALPDLHRPPQKCQKTNHLPPVTIALVKMWLGKSRFKKIRILLDRRSKLKLEGFQHATFLDLNMGYYHKELKPFSTQFCIHVFFRFGLSVCPDNELSSSVCR